jgi:hypothetical protein
VVSEHGKAFREQAEHAGGLPDFVVDEVEEYLRCGILEHGVVHLACRRCGHARVVGVSCKRGGLCPSCTGRRMADIAAHLVDEVLPNSRKCSALSMPGRRSHGRRAPEIVPA